MITSLTRSTISFFNTHVMSNYNLTFADKVYQFALPYFKAGTGLFFLGYGSGELYTSSRMATSQSKEYGITHGCLYLGAGVCSVLDSLHQFSKVNLGRVYNILMISGSTLFVFANIVSLEHNIGLYNQANSEGRAKGHSPATLVSMKSAILGILSSLGYIATAAAAILEGPAALAFLFGCVAAFFGGLKIIYDFYYDFPECSIQVQKFLGLI